MRHYLITKGVWIDLDQIRKAEFDDDGVLITWQDGATDKFAMPKGGEEVWEKNWARQDLWAKLRNGNPPQLLPAAPGHELVHFDTGWMWGCGVHKEKDVDIDTFDIESKLVREPVIAWEIQQPEPNNFPRANDHYRQAIGCGQLRQYNMDDQTGPHWTALVLPNGGLCAEAREHSYFDIDNKPLPDDYLTTDLVHFENLSKWIEYIRWDWKARSEWEKATHLEWEKANPSEAPSAEPRADLLTNLRDHFGGVVVAGR